MNPEYEWIFYVFSFDFNIRISVPVLSIVWEIKREKVRKREKLGFIDNKTLMSFFLSQLSLYILYVKL